MNRPRALVALVTAATAAYITVFSFVAYGAGGVTEALSGFGNQTNGFITQAEFDIARATFEERDDVSDGLGPVYNAQSCAECHQNPVTGGTSQISELRAGHRDGSGNFVDAPGGSLINDRAIHPAIQERVPSSETVRTFRMSTNTLGLGYVEAINSNTLVALSNNEVAQSNGLIGGEVIQVPVLEGTGGLRTGRFGWKNQHASLLSFAGDAYLNEIGIRSRLVSDENTSLGASVAPYDTVADVEDGDDDIDIFARFMRATMAPARDTALAATSDAIAGASLFNQVGCGICHVSSITTSAPGTIINGGTFTIPAALGNKTIHPYSDFLLHNV